MKKHAKLAKLLILLVLLLSLTVIRTPYAEAYTPPVDTIRIGLKYSSSAVSSANLKNVSGLGAGYAFGYFNKDRAFMPIGIETSEQSISVLIDKNMYYSSADNRYYPLTDTESVVVGCFHIQLETAYTAYEDAKAAIATFTSLPAFPKYVNGAYYVCVGNFTSRAAAESAAAGLQILQGYSITSGSSYTVTIVKTGTSTILMEYDCGANSGLAVRPIAPEGTKAQTWYSGYKYYGDFEYTRIGGGNLVVVNYLNIEDYVKGVIPYEMSPSWPLEALKAQAVCARTYAMSHLNRHSYFGFDLCNTDDCQVYYGTNRANITTDRAVEETAGAYLTYNGTLCETYYFSSDGGATETGSKVWTYDHGYLIGKLDPYEEAVAGVISNYYWTYTFTGAELATKLQRQGAKCSDTIVKFEILEFTDVGNVYKIRFTDSAGKTFTYQKAAARSIIGLRSQRYTVSSSLGDNSEPIYVNSASGMLGGPVSSAYVIGADGTEQLNSNEVYAISGTGDIDVVGSAEKPGSSNEPITFTIKGSGWGHNVGMSQWGAYSMAKNYGKTYEEILTFYFSNTQVEITQKENAQEESAQEETTVEEAAAS